MRPGSSLSLSYCPQPTEHSPLRFANEDQGLTQNPGSLNGLINVVVSELTNGLCNVIELTEGYDSHFAPLLL